MPQTAEDLIREPGELTPPEVLVRQAWPHHKATYFEPRPAGAGALARAEVNHDRWIVPCPFCAGAQIASTLDRRFFCVDCLHEGSRAEGRWVTVLWPNEKTRARIEELLARRPDPTTRNWHPDQTPKELAEENRRHLKAAS